MPRQAFALECCWVCHRAMYVPLHNASVAALGCYKVHQQCYSEELFESLGANLIYVARGHHLVEHYGPKLERKRPQSAEIGD